MRMRCGRVSGLMGVCLLLAGCGIRQAVTGPVTAQTHFGKLAPPASVGRYQLQPGQVAIPPALRHRVQPVYPPSLVHAGAEPVTVIVRLVVDREGNVTAIKPVTGQGSENHHALFVAAIRKAVAAWTFYPYRVQTPRPDGNVAQTPMPVTLRYAFRFTVVDGKPAVQSSHK